MALDLKVVGAVAAGLTVLWLIIQRIQLEMRRSKLKRQAGCLPAPTVSQWWVLHGLDLIYDDMRALKQRRLLDHIATKFAERGAGSVDENGNVRKVGLHTASLRLGSQRMMVTNDPENLKAIQATDFKSWAIPENRIHPASMLLGSGIFVTNGPEWQRSRDMLRPNFSKDHVRDLDSLETHVQNLMDRVPRDGSTVDLQDLFFGLTMDSATEFLFGESTHTLKPSSTSVSAAGFANALNKGQEAIFKYVVLGPLSFFNTGSDIKRHGKHLADKYVERGLARKHALDSKRSSSPTKYNFLDELVRQTDDKVRIRSELLNILLAGRDTTASLLANVWWRLSKTPRVWAALRREVDALDGRRPTFDDLRDMKYLRAILNESLRLNPVVPVNGRSAAEDTVLPRGGGPDGLAPCFVPKGVVVNFSVYALHRRKDLYGPDADEFVPERWLEGLRPGWGYLPFNGGARICLGQQFALTEASYATVRLMQEFSSIESRDPEPWTEWITLTTASLNGCKVALTPAAAA